MEDRVERRHPIIATMSAKKLRTANHTLPKTSSGRPTNASKLLRSDVRREDGRDSVGARAASGGEPQSSSDCNRHGIRVTREYW